AALYIEQSLDNRFRITTEATGWLAERVKDQQRKAEEASRALQAFCEREGMSFAGRQELQDQKMTALNAAALAAQTERITKENLASQLRALSPAERMNFPLIRGNTVVQTLRAEIAKLQEEERQMADRLGDRHPDLVDVRARIARTQEKLATEVREIAGMVESDYATAQKQEQHLRANAAAANREALTLSQKTIEYDALKRSVEIHQQLLKDLLGRSKETDLESELKATSLRLVERAELPQAPILPQRLRNYQIALLLGLALGVALSVLLERLDNTIKTPEDVRTQLNVPFLGMVPELLEHANPTADGAPVILKNPQSSPAEAYRVLRTNLAFCAAERSGRAYVVSSANPSEGKTTSVANLAIALAQSGARVLAIDADLRRPTLHQHFSVAKTPGLTDVIVSNCGLNEAVQGTSVRGLYLLPCGYVPPNPTDLLGSESMKDLVCELRQRYDWVLIDAPPILAMADAPLLCPLVEGLVLVVWAEKSGRPAIQRAIDSIGAVGGKLAGVVLNRVDLQRNSYYYSQHYGEYYRSYYLAQNETVRRPAKVVGKVGRS
ncbi:MAG: polysaccharide biosynthesis tyrosine autokinase, partial [Vicinamibacteria bacterium]|nr:polysaccharide biosynthesis tyrosine autokinase [Vicinamibacteria bacterium]